jgi:hypothetical protein
MTLQEMINNIAASATSGGMQKLAQEAEGSKDTDEEKKKPPMSKEEAERKAAKEEAQRGGDANEQEKVSALVNPEYVEKLASAVEYIVQTLVGPSEEPQGRTVLAQAAEQASPTVGAGKGAGASQTNLESPTGGEQPEESGQAKSQIPVKPATEAGANPKNPDNAMGTNESMSHPEQGEVMKQSSMLTRYIESLVKQGENATNPASISGSTTNKLPEDEPSQVKRPAEVTSQEKLIASNESVPDVTKAQAKAVPKKRLQEVLNEPALTASTDEVLDNALGADKVDQAGAKIAAKKVKVAAARALLRKFASEGCKCSLKKDTCEFCKIAAWAGKKRGGCLDKKSQATGVPPSVQVSGSGSATSPPPPPPSGAPQQ